VVQKEKCTKKNILKRIFNMRKDIKYLLKNNFNKYKEVGKKRSFLLGSG
jgi:hypothetical protein